MDYIGQEKTPSYEVEGDLHLDIRGGKSNKKIKKDLDFIEQVLRFSLIMGGFGKSWRRVWHQTFYPAYKTRAIGCHWHCLYDEFIDINSGDKLTEFLDHLYQQCQQYLGIQSPQFQKWREAWHPSRVKVYSQVVQQSQIIDLFHDDRFKNTIPIGGRFKNKEGKSKLNVSYVWHRMLPLPEGNYLEIVTLFSHQGDFNDQVRQNFIREIEKRGLTKTWGN
jgi:CRISPR-associated protein Cmr6